MFVLYATLTGLTVAGMAVSNTIQPHNDAVLTTCEVLAVVLSGVVAACLYAGV